MDEENGVSENEVEKINYFDVMRANPWMPATIVLAIVVIGLLAYSLSGTITGNVISENDIGQQAMSFINSQLLQTPGTLDSVKQVSGLYVVTIITGGKSVPVYFTKDGKFIAQGQSLVSVTGNAVGDSQADAPVEVPKTEKPVVDGFVFSYCPYGTQFEKALIPVYNLLKNKVDFNIVFIGAMHDSEDCKGTACFEKTESLRQICVQKLYGKDKLFSYLGEFDTNSAIGKCSGSDACLSPLLDVIYTKLAISKADVNSCMQKDAPALYSADEQKASSLGIGGSPGMTVNGVEVSAARDPASLLKAVCSGFATAPSECSQTLSSTSASAGFGASSGSASASAASCG